MASKHHGALRAGKPPSQRMLRVGEELRHALAAVLQRGDFHDPDLKGHLVIVSEVRISPDLKNATAFVTPLGGQHMDEMLAALRRAAPFLRGQIVRSVNLRHAPTLSFEPDTSFDYAGRIDAILHSPDVARDLSPVYRHPDERDGDEEDDSWDEEDADGIDDPVDDDAETDADDLDDTFEEGEEPGDLHDEPAGGGGKRGA